MTEPTPRINGIRQQYCTVDDAEQTTLVAVVATSLAYAEAWAVTRAGIARKIGRTVEGAIGKVDSAGVGYFADGTVRLWAAAADVGGGGATSHTVWFDFPDEVQPLPPASLVAGAYVTAPNGVIRALTRANFDGVLVLPLDQFDIPPCQWLSVKLTVSAPVAGRRAYVGGTDNVFGMLTCASQVAGVRNYNSGVVAPSADHTLIVRAETGIVNEVHLDIAGWCTL